MPRDGTIKVRDSQIAGWSSPLSGAKPDALVVLIHGYGSNVDDLISLPAVKQPALPGAAFGAPNAPEQIPFMAAAHHWWAIDTFSMAERAAGAEAAAPRLNAFISAELEAAGLTSDRLTPLASARER
jgi:phospholipase/carboxylesterase